MSILHGCTNICIPKGMKRRQENRLRLLGEPSQNYLNDSHLCFNFNATVLNIVKGKKIFSTGDTFYSESSVRYYL